MGKKPYYKKKRKPNMGYVSGKAFELTIKESGDHIGKLHECFVLARRILDSTSYGARKHNHEALCDILIIWKGVTVYIEAKTQKHARLYEIKHIRDTQYDTMLDIERSGGNAWFVFGQKNEAWEVERVWAVRPSIVNLWRGRASVTWDEIAQCGVELFKYPKLRVNSKVRWNLESLWD